MKKIKFDLEDIIFFIILQTTQWRIFLPQVEIDNREDKPLIQGRLQSEKILWEIHHQLYSNMKR